MLFLLCTNIIPLFGDNSTETEAPATTAASTAGETTTETATETEAEPKEPFISKKDFAALKEQYPHIYAWIEIPGTYIDYPLIQHPEDDNYYLRRSAEGYYSVNGCVFSEHRYNSTDFSDPITLLYGHYVKQYDGYKFFGGLQSIYGEELETNGEIIIYHPDKELHYEIFAATPYNSYHILAGSNYTKPRQFNDFIEGLKHIKNAEAVINRDYEVEAGDNLLVLSTCYNGNTKRRFIVVAKLVEVFD